VKVAGGKVSCRRDFVPFVCSFTSKPHEEVHTPSTTARAVFFICSKEL